MKLKNIVLVCKDLDVSKSFYKTILGLNVLYQQYGILLLSNHIILQSYEIWKEKVHRYDEEIFLQNHASALSFETEDIDEFLIKLDHYNIPLVHPLKEQAWGQRVVRFYDPDGHVIEVVESLRKVIKRYLNKGFSFEEISRLIGVPVDYIKKIEQKTL